MVFRINRMTVFKLVVKTIFFGGLLIFFIYALFNIKKPDQGSVIDNTITYTTETTTYTSTYTSNSVPAVQDVVDSIPKYVTVPEGGLDWKLFAQTKSIPYSFTNEDGRELHGVKPEFPSNLQKLDGQEITMQGYMFPLNADEGQSMFLFGPFPVSCPFHYHVGPALVIEAHAKERIEFKYEPVTLTGKLELISRDDDYNVFYRWHNVKVKQ